MNNTITHYQTSFRVVDNDGTALKWLRAYVHAWVCEREPEADVLRQKESVFFYRCDWTALPQTGSTVRTCTFVSPESEAWAMRYLEYDREQAPSTGPSTDSGRGSGQARSTSPLTDSGRGSGQARSKRLWQSDVGLNKSGGDVVVSIRVAYVWDNECLSEDCPEPPPSVPHLTRMLLKNCVVYSRRREFRLVEVPIRFNSVGGGTALAAFIKSPERGYPLLVFNGDLPDMMAEARRLAWDLAGKCQVAVVASNPELGAKLGSLLGEYWTAPDSFRVYFPFGCGQNYPERHRWYQIGLPEYARQRQALLYGLLRNHTLLEPGAVDSIGHIARLIGCFQVKRLKAQVKDFTTTGDEGVLRPLCGWF